jgi:hypothetical protein
MGTLTTVALTSGAYKNPKYRNACDCMGNVKNDAAYFARQTGAYNSAAGSTFNVSMEGLTGLMLGAAAGVMAGVITKKNYLPLVLIGAAAGYGIGWFIKK